ncbi:acyl carrier protein [Streptomyces sp. PmtG]
MTPAEQDVYDTCGQILLRKHVDLTAEQITPEATYAGLGLDSLALVEVLVALGAHFDVVLEDATVDSLDTLESTARVTAAEIDASGSPAPA